jgi:peptidoglycan hydrolase CwlO-like protein
MKISIKNLMNEMENKTLELAAAISELSSYKADNGKLIQELETKIMEKDALVSSLEERIRGSNDELRSTLENLEKLELEFEAAGKKSTEAMELNQKATNSLAKNFEIERTELLGKIANLDIELNISVNNAKEKDFMLQSLEIKIEELNSIIAKTQQEDQQNLKLHEFEKIEMEKVS